MIVIEHDPSKNSRMGFAIRKRELSQFLSHARKAIGINGEISVLLTGDERIRQLNREFRGKDKTTDVLSFPAPKHFAAAGEAGDLAISLDTALRQATDRGHALAIEVKVLMLHGLLHLAGYDHEKDSGEMAQHEARLRQELQLPLGLIERTKVEKPDRRSTTTKVSTGSRAGKTPRPRSRPRSRPGSSKR